MSSDEEPTREGNPRLAYNNPLSAFLCTTETEFDRLYAAATKQRVFVDCGFHRGEVPRCREIAQCVGFRRRGRWPHITNTPMEGNHRIQDEATH